MIELRLAADLLAKIRAAESHYHELAYLFVLESIEFLQTRLPTRRHVTGTELAHGCREYAQAQYGLMAKQVLDHWGIRQTDDIGRIVFTLVEVGLLMTQPTDREGDFHALYDFDLAFSAGYRWSGLSGRDDQG